MDINKYALPLYLVFLMELLQHTLLRDSFSSHLNPVLLLAEALFIAIYPVFIATQAKGPLPQKKKNFLLPALLMICNAISIVVFYKLIRSNPIAIERSDIIPLIDEVYLGRLFRGEYIYADYAGFGYGTGTPNYLTMHWLPFALSKLLHFDHRYTMVAILLGVYSWYGWGIIKKAGDRTNSIIKILLPYILLWCYARSNGSDLVQTVELLILAYYLILSLSLFGRNVVMHAIGITFPLLSRYALIFWLPFYAVHGWITDRPFILKVIAVSMIMACALYIVPFMIHDPLIFIKGTKLLDAATLGEWDGQSWQQPGDKPFQLYQHLGFASWFYEYYPGTLEQKMLACKHTMFIATLLAGLLPLLVMKKLSKRIPGGLMNVLALKFTLTFFYAFITIPYVYLSLVPVGISMVIVSRFSLLDQKTSSTI